MNRILIQVLLALFLALPLSAAEIKVSVDRNPINLNDSFQIIFSASEEPDSEPDLSPLQENFEILNQQHSSSSSWINGKLSRNEQWQVHVIAKQAGDILIPPISFGSDSTKPLRIQVLQAEDAGPQDNAEIFLEVSATPEKPYVQSQVIYTVRLYRRVQITQARLEEPQLKDAVIEKLGDDSHYSTQIQGLDYGVTERKYAIFPQQSGDMTITPLSLTAEILSQRHSRFGGFFNQQLTETRRLSSKAITLHVQPVPAAFKGTWLAAEELELSQEWSAPELEATVGEPLTRTLRLTAKGATVGQLPELAPAKNPDAIKTYPDQPVLKEDKTSDGLTASREEKIAYIPGKAGDYTLPTIEVQWFNLKTRQIETARLDAVKIKALPGKNAPPAAAPAPAPETQTLNPAPETATGLAIWQTLTGFCALGWAATMYLYLRRPRQAKPETAVKPNPAARAAVTADKRLQRACQEHDAQAAKQALLQWGKVQYAADSLGNLAGNCREPLRDEIELLNQHLYSDQNQDWNGAALWQAFSQNQRPAGGKQASDEALEPLYKL